MVFVTLPDSGTRLIRHSKVGNTRSHIFAKFFAALLNRNARWTEKLFSCK